MSSSFQCYAECSSYALAIVDIHNIIQYANHILCSMLSETTSSVVGRPLSNLPFSTAFNRALHKGLVRVRNTEAEHQFTLGAKESRYTEMNCRMIPLNEDSQIIIELFERHEVAQLKEALQSERILRRRADLLRERGRKLFFDVIGEMPVFIYMQRRDYTVAYANKKTVKFYGETEGRRCYEVFGGRNQPCPHCPTFQVFETGQPVDWQFSDSDGRTFHIYDYPFEDENGEPLVMEIGVDITELKRVERELFQAQKMRAIGVLAGGIAHDLNNNLVPIIFNIDHALAKSTNSANDAPLSEALRAAYKAAELVEQVLEYSRQQDVSRSPLRLTPLAQENLSMLQASLPAHISLEVDYSAHQDCILATPAQIQQILLNLCRNAVQAMPDGGTLSVAISNLTLNSQKDAPHPGLGLGNHVIMKVSDTGHGIEVDALERIFEPFYTSKQKSGGTGMGLAVVHAIANCNGGSIHVDNAQDSGAIFTVYLPCATPETEPIPEESHLPLRTTGRLLLVDDDNGALQAMRRVLRDAGYEVFTADNGEEGLKEFFRAKGQCDLVLTDQSMPSMTGIDMAARILEHDPSAKIIICTGHVEPHLEAQAKKAGVAGFLMKPMSPRALVENIRKYCA